MRQGMKLIFDEVLNHTGSNYWWIRSDLPFKDWLNFPDKYTPTNHRRTVNQDIHASDYDKNLWSKGWFDRTMPDMNGQNPFTWPATLFKTVSVVDRNPAAGRCAARYLWL